LLSQNKFFRMIPIPFPKTNQDRILRAEKLMSFDPSHFQIGSLTRNETALKRLIGGTAPANTST
jgi:hypothetical protein